MRHSLISLVLFATMTLSCIAQHEINKVVVDPRLKKEILLGSVNETGLKNNSVFKDAKMYYDVYKVDSAQSDIIKHNSKKITIKVVFGSWCGDSRINVPAFQKIVEDSYFDNSKIEYIAVDRKKEGGTIDVSNLDIKYVPTFIFYRENKEIGRIIEYPKSETIEKDWAEIVTKK